MKRWEAFAGGRNLAKGMPLWVKQARCSHGQELALNGRLFSV